jgi:hypothetical protein
MRPGALAGLFCTLCGCRLFYFVGTQSFSRYSTNFAVLAINAYFPQGGGGMVVSRGHSAVLWCDLIFLAAAAPPAAPAVQRPADSSARVRGTQ